MAAPGDAGPGEGVAGGPGVAGVPLSAEALLLEMELFELRCQGEDAPDRLLELCRSHGLDAAALVNELLAFVSRRHLEPRLSPEQLDAFEHELLTRRSTRPPRAPQSRRPGTLHDIRSLQHLLDEDDDDEEEEQLLDAYTTPSKVSQKRGNSTPETPRPKRTPSSRSPYALFSPSSFSPSVTPSQKYASRGGRGEVVTSFGSVPPPDGDRGARGGCVPRLFGDPGALLTRGYKFMYHTPWDIREALCWRMEALGDALRAHHHLDDFTSALLPAQEPVTVLGQIGCDGNGKLNARSVVLEGDRHHSCGARVPLELLELGEFSLFPGQVVALEGTNSTGRRMMVSKVYEGVPLPFHTPTEPAGERRLVLAACGPYTTSDSLAYDPLTDLISVITRDRPDVCILFGPFLDAKHEQVENFQLLGSFADVFKFCLKMIIDGTRSAGSQLVFVPSARDVHHDAVYPQPPFSYPELSRDDRARVHFVPDPCTLEIEGVVLGLTSTDLLLHMGAEEISSSAGGSDRFTRILKHVLTQRSYYPLYPPSEELNVDYEGFYSYSSLPVTPDVLITPSELRYFIKDVLGCVCINPGRLTKGQVGGTYCRLYLQREDSGAERRSPCVAAQVVKI